MDEQLENYLLKRLPPVDEWVLEIEDQAQAENIPIMDQVSMNFLMQLVSIRKPKRILEIGTAIGYSSLRMLEAHPSTSIVTIEKDEYRYKQAIKHINKQNKQTNIEVIFGEAVDEMTKLTEKDDQFDFIFIDAAKGEYKEFFEQACPLLMNDGLILSDNVLFRGYVANLNKPIPKYKNTVQKIRDYNDWLVKHPDFITSIIPIGDGLAISYRKAIESEAL